MWSLRTGRRASSRTSLPRRSHSSKKRSQSLPSTTEQLLQALVHLFMEIGWRTIEDLRALAIAIEQKHLRHCGDRSEWTEYFRVCHDDAIARLQTRHHLLNLFELRVHGNCHHREPILVLV